MRAAQAVLALRLPVVSPRLSQTSGGHTLRVACAKQLQLLTPEVGQQLRELSQPCCLVPALRDGEIFHFSLLGSTAQGHQVGATCISIPHLLPFPAGSCSSFSACGHADSKLLQQPLQLQVICPLEPHDSSFAVLQDQQGHRRSNTNPSVIKNHWAGREQSKYSWWHMEWLVGKRQPFCTAGRSPGFITHLCTSSSSFHMEQFAPKVTIQT